MAYIYNPSKNNPSNINKVTDKNNSVQPKDQTLVKIFDPTIQLDELSIPEYQQKLSTQKEQDDLSVSFPLIKINDYIFSENEIEFFRISSKGVLPTVLIRVRMINDLFLAANMPKDGDIISVMIRQSSDTLQPIRNDYVVTGVNTDERNMEDVTFPVDVSMTITGELFVPQLKSATLIARTINTSMEALKLIAKDLGLGFVTNETETNDKQLWLCPNITMIRHINNIVEKSYKDENSFFDWWIDIYYCLNFINVNKMLLKSEDKIDVAAYLSNVDKGFNFGIKTGQENTNPMVKMFTNVQNFKNTPFYINNYKVINNSIPITFNFGTSMYCEFFEHNDVLYQNNEQLYRNLKVDTLYDETKVKTHILLKGRAKYDKNNNPDELALANYNYNDLYKKFPWLGVQYTNSFPDKDIKEWNGNCHKNYYLAHIQNVFNLAELEKLNLEIETIGWNGNVIKGEKVPVYLVEKDSLQAHSIKKDNKDPNYFKINFYSGWFYVKSFELYWEKIDNPNNMLSKFRQIFTLTRREWPAPVPVTNPENLK